MSSQRQTSGPQHGPLQPGENPHGSYGEPSVMFLIPPFFLNANDNKCIWVDRIANELI